MIAYMFFLPPKYNQSIYQNNNIISLFSNIFENPILNTQTDDNYINNLFRNYFNKLVKDINKLTFSGSVIPPVILK